MRLWLLIGVIGLGSGCSDFLRVESEDELSRNDLFSTVRGADAAVLGLYHQLGEEDYYRFRLAVYADLPANTVPPEAGGGSQGEFAGVQLGLVRLHSRELDAALEEEGIRQLYARAYRILFQANDILSALPGVTDGTEERIASLTAEARTIRALVHFDLVRLFAQAPGFTSDANHPGIALIDGVTDAFDQPARSSVAEVYAFIQSDLEAAAADIDPAFTRRSNQSYWLTPAAVAGLLARVKSYVRDWEGCRDWADRCIEQSPVDLTPAETYLAGWRGGALSEIIWELDVQRIIDNDEDLVALSPARIFGSDNPEPFLEVSADLEASYAPDDLRLQLLGENGDGQLQTQKWPFDTNAVRNPPLLRLSEAYLLRAEAHLELGDLSAATEDYLTVHRRSVPDGPPPPTDENGLRQAIREERRRELAFEGHHFFDLGRWGLALERQDCADVVPDCTIPYPDPRFVLPIPLEAILRNDNLEQNEGY